MLKAARAVEFDSDRPIDEEQADRLGFSEIAEKLAKVVADSSADEGLVVGIDGAWGSGKSSLLNFIAARLAASPNLHVLRFDPWLIGDRDSMVATLIGEFAAAIETIQQSQSRAAKAKHDLSDLANKLREYGATTSRGMVKVAQIAALAGMPGAEVAAKGFEVAGQLLGPKSPKVPLTAQRAEIFDRLGSLTHRFVVLVDDLDRLEPAEAAEMLRVIRAVGDFPRVIYILCYDKQVLANSLEAALSVDDGSAFLQKVVQISFQVPSPEEFDLRRWFLAECRQFHQLTTRKELDEFTSERLAQVCDKEGAFLHTPRDVTLVLNAIRLAYPPVAGQVDFPDMCWLQLVRTTNPELYRWIQRYLGLFAAVVGRYGMVHEGERRELWAQLKKCLHKPDDVYSASSVWRLSEIVPGIGHSFSLKDEDSHKNVLARVSTDKLSALEVDRRLGSPQHFRFYFSFSLAGGALEDETYHRIVGSRQRRSDLVVLLKTLVERSRRQGGTLYGVFLDRLQRSSQLQTLAENLILAVADTVDDAERKQPRGGPFGGRDYWRGANEIVRIYLKHLVGRPRVLFLAKLFKSGRSIGFLVEELVGRELFDHGRIGAPRATEDERMLLSAELDQAIGITFGRLQGRDSGRILEVPSLMTFLHRWQQAGGGDAMRRWAAKVMKTDEGFLAILENCRGWRSSDRVYYPLMKRDISIFVDFEAMKSRLRKLSTKRRASREIHAKARELLEAARQGERDFASDAP